MPDAMSIWAGDQCFERVRSGDGKSLVLIFSFLLLLLLSSGSYKTAHTAPRLPFRQPPPSTAVQSLLPFVTTESRHLFISKRFSSGRVIFCSLRKLFFFLRGPLRIQTWHLSSPAVLIFQQQRWETGTEHVAKWFPNPFSTACFVNKKNLLTPTFIWYVFR